MGVVAESRQAAPARGMRHLGGPDQQQAPGLLIHGFPLPGAVEISPGTRIYTGGVQVARPNFSAEFNETADRSCIFR